MNSSIRHGAAGKRARRLGPVLGLVLLLVAGCGGEDPVAPAPPVYDSPDALMDRFRSRLAENTLAGFDHLFRDDFRFVFSAGDVFAYNLPTGHMYSAEWLNAFGHVFSGDPVTNWRGESIPAVVFLTLENMDRTIVWSRAGEGGAFPGTLRALYWVQFRVKLDDGQPPFSFVSYLDVHCADMGSTDGAEAYRLAGITEIFSTVETGAPFSFGSLSFRFFANEAPEVRLDFQPLGTSEETRILADACGSRDREHPEAILWYRWGTSADGPWTFWGPHCDMEFAGPAEDPLHVHVEVRDRWGAVTPAGDLASPGTD